LLSGGELSKIDATDRVGEAMPFSWVRVSGGTSPKVRRCMGEDHSKQKFADCVRAIVEDDRGRVESLWFEDNGRYARVRFYWETQEQKAKIIFDLEADQVIDLLTPEQVDDLIREREEAS
jgi:hypothetical protein